LKIMYAFIRKARKKLEETVGEECKLEYSNYAYDIVCGKYLPKYYKVKKPRGGSIIITYAEYLDAREVINNLHICIVDDDGNIYSTIPFKKFLKMIYGVIEPPVIEYRGKALKIKPTIVGGRLGKEIKVYVPKQLWVEIKKRLELVDDPVDYFRSLLVD